MQILKRQSLVYTIVTLSFIFISSALPLQPPYKLTYFIRPQCRFCSYMANKIKRLIQQQMYWSQKIYYEIVDCNIEQTKNECVNNFKTPHLEISQSGQQGKILGKLQEIKSYYYYRDWLKELIEFQIPQKQQVETIGNYKYFNTSYQSQLLVDYQIELQRKILIRKNKFNIIQSVRQEIKLKKQQESNKEMQVSADIHQSMQSQQKSNTVDPTQAQLLQDIFQKQQDKQFHFKGFGLLGNLALLVPLLAFLTVRCVQKSQQRRRNIHRQRVRIPEDEADDYD